MTGTVIQAVDAGLTIVRIHGELVMWLEAVGTIGDGFVRGAFGMCVVSENASGVGITAVPHPIDDNTWGGWIVHRSFGPLMGLSVTESDNTGPLSVIRTQIDSKSMRHFKETDVLIAALALTNEIGVATVSWGFQSRILLKLA